MKKDSPKVPWQTKSGIKENSRIWYPKYTSMLVNRACTLFLIGRGLMEAEGHQWTAVHHREIVARGRRKP